MAATQSLAFETGDFRYMEVISQAFILNQTAVNVIMSGLQQVGLVESCVLAAEVAV